MSAIYLVNIDYYFCWEAAPPPLPPSI